MDFGSPDLIALNQEYLKYTAQVAESCTDRDLSEERMVIGTSAIMDTEIDGAVGMNSGIFNNPFIIWGKYRTKVFSILSPDIVSVSSHADGWGARGKVPGKPAE